MIHTFGKVRSKILAQLFKVNAGDSARVRSVVLRDIVVSKEGPVGFCAIVGYARVSGVGGRARPG